MEIFSKYTKCEHNLWYVAFLRNKSDRWKVAKLPAKVFNSLVRQGRIWVFS